MMNFWIVIVIIVLAATIGSALLGVAIATAIREAKKSQARSGAAKPKRHADDFDATRLAEPELIWTDDDGELLDLDERGPFLEEKPKRREQD